MKKTSVFAAACILAAAVARGDDKPPASPTPGASPAPAASADATPAPGIAPEKRAEIEKMLKLTGAEKLMAQVLNQMTDSMKTRYPKVPPEFWQKMQQEMDLHSLLEQMIPVYDKYYTLDDLKAANAFYESPAGQKMQAARPLILQETMKIGQEWGRKIGTKIMGEIKEEKSQDKKPEEDKPKSSPVS